MEGVGFPDVLLSGGETPHSFALRPSHSRMLSSADIIIRIGDGFEGFLKKPLSSLARRATVLQLDSLAGLELYAYRRTGRHNDKAEEPRHTGGHASGHDHDHDHGHDHGQGVDPHLWLHTGNAIRYCGRFQRRYPKPTRKTLRCIVEMPYAEQSVCAR
jgi:zinc transport system substrate-binding protein